MAGEPWGKFYWSDWLADPKLKLCSLAAQGLWMRMLCIAAEADPVGFVVLEGNTLGAEELATECGKPVDAVRECLAELAKWGVYSTDRKGRIYSRRMVADVKKAKIARKNGKSGGNPSLRKTKENGASDNPRVITHMPEARVQNKPPIPPDRGGAPTLFDEAWKAYPIGGRGNRGPAKAKAEWPAAAERAGGENRLLAAVRAHAKRLEQEPRQTPRAFDRWLRDDGFAAYLPARSGATASRWVGPHSIWDAVAAAKSPAFANTWLAGCEFEDGPQRAVVSRSPTAVSRLRQEVGSVLREMGIEIREVAA